MKMRLRGTRPGRMTWHDAYLLQIVAEQVVLAVEQTFSMSGPRKKAMAIRVVRQILDEQQVHVGERMLQIAVEAAVHVMNLLEQQAS